MWYECSWTGGHGYYQFLTSIAGRIGFACYAYFGTKVFIDVMTMQDAKSNLADDEGDMFVVVNTWLLLPHLLSTFALLCISLYFLTETYRERVRGPVPKVLLLANKSFQSSSSCSPSSQRLLPASIGKVAMVTGANAGIGKEVTRQLLTIGFDVVMACRNLEKARLAVEDIVADFDHVDSLGKKEIKKRLHLLEMDVSDLSSVRNAVNRFRSMIPITVSADDDDNDDDDDENVGKGKGKLGQVDLLIANAGVMMNERQMSVNGYELTMAANHLGHFLLVNLLLPDLRYCASRYSPSSSTLAATNNENIDIKKKDDKARVILVTSSTYILASHSKSNGIDLNDLQCIGSPPGYRTYGVFSQYAQSKLANILTGRELWRRERERQQQNQKQVSFERKLSINLVHPGLVRTDVTRNMPPWLRLPNAMFGFILAWLQKTPMAGAYTIVHCATNNSDDNDGDVLMTSTKGKGGAKHRDGYNGAKYYVNSRPTPLHPCAMDDEAAAKLWKLSEELVKISSEK